MRPARGLQKNGAMNKRLELQRERNAAIIRLRAKGKSNSEMAAQFGVSPGRVQQIVARGNAVEKRWATPP
jgi:transposase